MNNDAKRAIILLLKGIFYKKDDEKAFFEMIESSRYAIAEYLETIGVELVVHEDDGYAYLQNIVYEEEDEALPKLIASRPLSYKVSLLCVLLRQKIALFESQSEDERAIVSKEDIISQLLLFLDIQFNEVKIRKDIETTIKKVEGLGFLKQLKTDETSYEIQRAIKSFVDAQWLDGFDEKLQEYKEAKIWS
ncbi:MAG: DUF4194 domain-containing protein [Sulfurovum sp.]|nr:DUF4194 domain-containing protein [Sulfurovum sp.]